MKKTHSGIETIDRSIERTNEWLNELSLLLGTEDHGEAFTTLRSVLHALRDRLPLIANSRLAAQLPIVLRGVYYEGWQPDRGHVHTRSLREFLALVERDAPHGDDLSAEDKARSVFGLLVAHLDSGEVDRLVSALPLPVQELFPRRRGDVVPVAPARSSLRHVRPAKTA